MVSTTLTTIVSATTQPAATANNHHNNYPTAPLPHYNNTSQQVTQSGSRNFYFSTTFSDPKTTSAAVAAVANSIVVATNSSQQQQQQHEQQQQNHYYQSRTTNPVIGIATTSPLSSTLPISYSNSSSLSSAFSTAATTNLNNYSSSTGNIDCGNNFNSSNNSRSNQVKISDPIIVTSSTTNSALSKSFTSACITNNSTAKNDIIPSAISTTNATCIASSLSSSSSPPLSDQISLLFPKCRPKNDVNLNPVQNNNNNNNNSKTNTTTLTAVTANTTNSSSPPSSSSISSESLSSVTPRISTNPFLSLNLMTSASNQQQQQQQHHQQQQQYQQERYNNPSTPLQTPQTNIPSYYYHSSSTSSIIKEPQNTIQSTITNLTNTSTNSYNSSSSSSSLFYSDMPRKRNNNSSNNNISNNSNSYHISNQNPFIKENYWETRHNTTPASTVLNSPELTENENHRNHHFITKQHVKVGRSPVSHSSSTAITAIDPCSVVGTVASVNSSSSSVTAAAAAVAATSPATALIIDSSTIDLDTPTRDVAVVAGGEVVVFDDISENWQNLRVTPEEIPTSMNLNKQQQQQLQHIQNDEIIDGNCDEDKYNDTKLLDRNFGITNDTRHGIMEYEGSPRKIGQTINDDEEHEIQIQSIHQQNSNLKHKTSPSSMYTARPGFPQRIISPPQESPPPILNIKQLSSSNNAEDTSNDVSEIGTSSDLTTSEQAPKSTTFDYLYEFSETRKVLEEFFKCPSNEEKAIENGSDVDSIDIHYEFRNNMERDQNYIGHRLANSPLENYQHHHLMHHHHHHNRDNDVDDDDDDADVDDVDVDVDVDIDDDLVVDSPCQQNNFTNGIDTALTTTTAAIATTTTTTTNTQKATTNGKDHNNHDIDFFLDSASRSSGEQIDNQDGINQNRIQSRSFRYSPETTDYDSNCGDLDSLSGEFNGLSTYPSYSKYYAASMPVLEDGLSSGHASDTENNNPPTTGISMLMDMKRTSLNDITENNSKMKTSSNDLYCKTETSPIKNCNDELNRESILRTKREREMSGQSPNSNNKVFKNIDPELDSLYSISVFHRSDPVQITPPPPAPAPHRKPSLICPEPTAIVDTTSTTALKDLRTTLQRAKTIPPGPYEKSSSSSSSRHHISSLQPTPIEKIPTSPILGSPVWVPRHSLETNSKTSLLADNEHLKNNLSADEEEVDTDLETDRLLGHQRLDDKGFYDDNKTSWDRKPRSLLASSLSKFSPKVQQTKNAGSSLLRQGLNSLLPTTPEVVPTPQHQQQSQQQHQPQSQQQQQQAPPPIPPKNSTNKLLDIGGSVSSPDHSDKSSDKSPEQHQMISPSCNMDSPEGSSKSKRDCEKKKQKTKNKEGNQPVLIEGVLFRARYLGSTQLVCEGQPTKSTRMMQAEEAVSRIKAPDGDVQPSTEVDLFISTEKIMVLNTDLKEIMMDHALRTISYIADIGDLVVLMARRRFVPQDIDDAPKPNRTPKMICHVFESDEAQFIAQSIGQAFQVAYMEFLKANGIEDHSFVKEMDYQEVLNSQEIFGDELEIFAKKELQKEVVVPKAKGEILGVVIVESGWGSMLPTVVIANLMSSGAAARCGQLNIGDQLIAINGMSLVGLPLSTCQNYIKNTKNQTVVKFTVVPCPPVVEVKIKRPNTKYQLGFSVQNGVICSLLRGGIAERGGVRVGHRIIEINNQSVVAVPHEKIVNLLATSVGEILMKTMPTSMFRLLTGQENPIYI